MTEERADEFLLMGLRLPKASTPRDMRRWPDGRSILSGSRRWRLMALSKATLAGGSGSRHAGFPVLDAVVADLAA